MNSTDQRFAIARSKWIKPLLRVVGATPARSYVTVEPDRVRARFGYYSLEIPMDRIKHGERSSWPWFGGLGIRTNLRNAIALTGTYDNIVRLDIDPPVRATVVKIPINMTHLYLSMDEPDEFLEAYRRVRDSRSQALS